MAPCLQGQHRPSAQVKVTWRFDASDSTAMSTPRRSSSLAASTQLRCLHDDYDAALGQVVDHDVQLAAGIGGGDLLEEGQELLVAVPVGAGLGDLAGGHLEGGEQRGGAVPDVIEAGRLRMSGAHRQRRRAALQRLDLRLLIDTAPPPAPADADTARRRRGSCPPGPDRWRT